MEMLTVMVMVNLAASCQSSLDSSFASISKTPDCIFYEPLKSSRSMSVVLYHLNTWGRHSRDQLGQLGRRSASGKAETLRQHNPSKHTEYHGEYERQCYLLLWGNCGMQRHFNLIKLPRIGDTLVTWDMCDMTHTETIVTLKKVFTFDSAALSSFRAGASASVMAAWGRPVPWKN